MSIDRVREYLKQFDVDYRILEFPVSSATVALAAEALGVEPARIAKTLGYRVGEGAIVIVAAGDARVDNKKFKTTFGLKAKMLTSEETVALVGHAVGGVCPFAVNDGVSVWLDDSLKRFSTVFPACGSSNSAIELTIKELESISGGQWCDVCKLPEV